MAGMRPFKEDQRDFYHAYGLAMAYWAGVEYQLGDHFIAITKMQESMGREIFFSARSFLGRADMLVAALPYARTIPAGRNFLTDAVRLTRTWQSARNSLAHDMHGIIMQPGRDLFPAISPLGGGMIEKHHIENASENFFNLSQLLQHSRGRKKLLREPELCAQALALLPTDVLASAVDRKLLAPLITRIGSSPD